MNNALLELKSNVYGSGGGPKLVPFPRNTRRMTVRHAAALDFVLLYEALTQVYQSKCDLFADVRLQKLRSVYVSHRVLSA